MFISKEKKVGGNLFTWLSKKLTKNYTEVPLFWVIFDLQKYKENGSKNSCIANLHPELKNDEYIISKINDIVGYIRDNYDMEKISKI